MARKESRRFYLSVEGQCEQLYFNHIENLINNCGKNRYQAVIVCKQLQPLQFCKRFVGNADRKDVFLHVQDIEDYYNKSLLNNFYALLKNISDAKKIFGINYELGYSNYSFELWLLLHVCGMSQTLSSRKDYLRYINKYFQKKYVKFEQFKSEKEFCSILNEFVTIDSVKYAIKNAEKIVAINCEAQKHISYKNFEFYPQNPDLTVHRIVDRILKTCGVL